MSSKKRSKRKQRDRRMFPNKNEMATHLASQDFAGMIDWLPNPDVILKELGQDQKAYENILSDSHLTGTIQQRKLAITGMNWEIDRGKAQSRQAKAITMAIQNLDVYRIISDILDAPYWGMIPLEVIWKQPNENGLILPLEVTGKPPEWFQFDAHNILKFVSRKSPVIGEDIPPRKFLLARHNATYKNPYGNPLLSKVFWPVTFKKGGWKFWVAFGEKYGAPTVIGKVPRASDETEYQKLADILADTIQDGVIVMPDDSEVEVLGTDRGASSAMFKDLITFANQEISKAILSQTLTTEATETGTQALGTVHAKVAGDVVISDKRMVEDCFNTLIRWISEINFGSSKEHPLFTLYHDEDVDLNQANRDKILADTGQIQFTQDYIDETYGFEKGHVIVKEKETPAAPGESGDNENEFAEAFFKDQRAIDRLIESFGPNDLEAQSAFIKPILSLGRRSQNFTEFKRGLIDIFPDVRPDELEETLRNSLFVSEVWGNLNGSEN